MNKMFIVSDKRSLDEVNRMLDSGLWWVEQATAGSNNSWLVVLTDTDPDNLFYEEEDDDGIFDAILDDLAADDTDQGKH